MPKVDVERLMAEDVNNDQFKDIPWRFGENIAVNFNPGNSGTWDILPNGDKLWRLGIKSLGAFTINLTFDKYHLPPGATLFVYNETKTHVIGAFTDYNNQEDMIFATTLVIGDAIIIEYFEPASPEFQGEINLNRVTHGYRDAYGYAKSFGESGACNNNVKCPEAAGWENQIKSACMLVTGGSGFCSGSLVNNTSQDGTPYVLTANHCYSSPGSWVFWFNWESPTCTNPGSSPPYNSMSGATLKARKTDSDFCLVQMNSAPPLSYNVYYSGWNRADVPATSGVGIHHPSGDIKKISYVATPFISSDWNGNPPANSHWQTNWSDGVTEGGSSGSPIFDQNHRIVGQLHGGPSSCGSSQLWDFYGKFSMSWDLGTTPDTRLKDWLDPTNTAVIILDGYDPALPLPIVVTLAANPVTSTTATLNGTANPNGHATTCYFEWGTSVSYGNNTSTQSIGAGTGNVAVNAGISGLTPGLTYHFRLVASNSFGTSTGEDMTFIPGAAAVTTTAVSAITLTTATSGGNVLYDGGSPVTVRGVCWSTSANPVVSGNHTTDGSGPGSYTSSIIGLAANTTYYIRAYATNSNGTFYGNELSFTTLCGVYSLPFSESFPSTTIPNCWSQVDHQGNGQIWEFGTITGQSPLPNLTGNYAYLDSDNYGSGNSQNADLQTPILDFSGYTTVNLQFNHYFKAFSSSAGTLSYSIDGGAVWTVIQQFTTTSSTNPAVFNQSIVAVAGQPQVKFKWNYTGNYAYSWAIDDILITGTGGVTLIVSPSNQNVTQPAGSTSFSVTCPVAWTALSDMTWCSPTPSGSGSGTITAAYTENTTTSQRIANITVSASGAPTRIVTVTQAGITPTLSITPSNQNVATPPGSTTFAVTSNSDWNVGCDVSWCVPTMSGSGNGTINAAYTENPMTYARIATLTVTVSGLPAQTVTVTQAGAAPVLSVTPPNQNVLSPGGFTTFTVTCNSDWTIVSNASWCVPTPAGTGNGIIDAVYEENTSLTSRVATLTVTVSGLPAQTVTVTQAGAAPTLSVQPVNQDVNANAGSATFSVTSNANWSVVSNAAWCTVPATGTGNGTIVASYTENPEYIQRIASISVTVTGLTAQVVTVTQDASTVSTEDLTNDEIRIFPNPTKGVFTIATGKLSQQSLEITVVDYTGKVILTKIDSGKTAYTFDLSNSTKGCYFVKIKSESELLVRKLVIL
ncbi:MAG: BACON domain-containing carbohydrate-binding protein [bacterium]